MLLNQVIRAIQPIQVLGHMNQSVSIDYLLTDSRQLNTTPQNTLFFAIKTEKNDGANYVNLLWSKGIKVFVVSRGSQDLFSHQEGMCVLLVENVLQALQDLAAYKRSLYSCPVIAITGSNGKTVVKEWLYQLLKEDFYITRSPKSYNSQIGVPLSVWQSSSRTPRSDTQTSVSVSFVCRIIP
jgi:alanine racemase